MTAERRAKLESVVQKRQLDLTIILENIRDHHNVGAVLRSCDAVGIREIFVLQSDPLLQKKRIALGKRTSAGTRKWVDVHYFTDVAACFQLVRKTYRSIFSTHLSDRTKSLYELDLTQPVALLFGSEQLGVSEQALALSDGNFTIPQVGMAASLNISVACAVSVYEAYRQRYEKGFYNHKLPLQTEQQQLLDQYMERSKNKAKIKAAEVSIQKLC